MATVNREREFLKFLMQNYYLGVFRIKIIARPCESFGEVHGYTGSVELKSYWESFVDFADVVDGIDREIRGEPALPAVCPIITEDGEG